MFKFLSGNILGCRTKQTGITIFLVGSKIGQNGGASRWRVCYKRGLSRLVLSHLAVLSPLMGVFVFVEVIYYFLEDLQNMVVFGLQREFGLLLWFLNFWYEAGLAPRQAVNFIHPQGFSTLYLRPFPSLALALVLFDSAAQILHFSGAHSAPSGFNFSMQKLEEVTL